MADLKKRAEEIVKRAQYHVASYRLKQAAGPQTVWVIVDPNVGKLEFGQSQIASAPVYEDQISAEEDLENFEDSLPGHIVAEATLTINSPSAAPIVSSEEKLASPMEAVYEPGLKRYPEFKPLVDELRTTVIRTIQAKADAIESKMPYKQQFVLEELIRLLQESV